MRLTEELYQKYLEELEELHTFKLSHSEGYFGILKEVMEDPHTKHLVETLAFFIARSHLHGEHTILNIYRGLFRQYFPYLWTPLPSMGLIQLLPSNDVVESRVCNIGTEINLQTTTGKRVYFQTTQATKILPIRLSEDTTFIKKDGHTQFLMKFKSSIHHHDEIGKFRLYTNCLNDFISSWSFNIALRQNLKRVRIYYDTIDYTSSQDTTCTFDFPIAENNHSVSHPVEQLRSHINCPEQELFIDINVPVRGEKWKSFTFIFDLGNDWPETFPLSSQSLLPFVVPIVNLQKKAAETIRCDGTKDSYPVLHPSPEKKFTVHSFRGIYILKNHKPIPLTPNFVGSDDESYEIVPQFIENQPIAFKLQLNIQEALRNPQLVVAEVMWYQPWFDKLDHDARIFLMNQILKGLDIRFVGDFTSPEDQTSSYDIKLLTRLLSLKNQTELGLDEVLFLLNILKINQKSHFKEIPEYIKDLKVNQRYDSLVSGLVHEYSFLLHKLDDKNQNLVLLYFRNVKRFLDLWLTNVEIEVSINAANFKEPIVIKEGTSHETSALVRNKFLFQ